MHCWFKIQSLQEIWVLRADYCTEMNTTMLLIDEPAKLCILSKQSTATGKNLERNLDHKPIKSTILSHSQPPRWKAERKDRMHYGAILNKQCWANSKKFWKKASLTSLIKRVQQALWFWLVTTSASQKMWSAQSLCCRFCCGAIKGLPTHLILSSALFFNLLGQPSVHTLSIRDDELVLTV